MQIAHAGGGHQLTLRLDPEELGKVDIRIDRAADGTATVQVTVDRAETLKLMLADQPQLHRALDAAGVPQDGRSLTLSLGAQPQGGGASGGPGTGSFGTGSGTGNHSQAGAGARQDRQPSRPSPLPSPSGAASPWLRAGVDITA
ncbi:MAG: flagellar hook-length control protein FliK [Acetobacteraceae bacterium]